METELSEDYHEMLNKIEAVNNFVFKARSSNLKS